MKDAFTLAQRKVLKAHGLDLAHTDNENTDYNKTICVDGWQLKISLTRHQPGSAGTPYYIGLVVLNESPGGKEVTYLYTKADSDFDRAFGRMHEAQRFALQMLKALTGQKVYTVEYEAVYTMHATVEADSPEEAIAKVKNGEGEDSERDVCVRDYRVIEEEWI